MQSRDGVWCYCVYRTSWKVVLRCDYRSDGKERAREYLVWSHRSLRSTALCSATRMLLSLKALTPGALLGKNRLQVLTRYVTDACYFSANFRALFSEFVDICLLTVRVS